MTAISVIQITLAILLSVAILLQHSDAGAGGAFGGGDSVSSWRTRRGFEKVLFVATIILAILFVVSAIVALSLTPAATPALPAVTQ
ncbi:MAG: hypothetical protein RL094_665 [Candidatus Parcubacteria bacterium]|jgi:preprotein translocase subunit SecG